MLQQKYLKSTTTLLNHLNLKQCLRLFKIFGKFPNLKNMQLNVMKSMKLAKCYEIFEMH